MKKEIILVILIAWFIVLFSGLTSQLYLGDEAYHYRFAKDWFNSGKRPLFDSAYDNGTPPGYFYSSEILWPMTLSCLWKIFGKISFPLAQVYHSLYFLIFLISFYLVAKKLYDERIALYSMLILLSVPMVSLYGTVFYLEIPVVAFVLLTLLLLLEKKYFWAGITLGLVYLTKRSGIFFLPAFLLIILWDRDTSLKRKMFNLLVFLFISLLIVFPDIAWREFRFRADLPKNISEGVGSVGSFKGIVQRIQYPAFRTWKRVALYQSPLQPSLLNLLGVVKFLGPVILLLLLSNVFFIKDKKKDKALFILIISYFIGFMYFFGIFSDIRYVFLVLPFIAILSAKYLVLKNKGWITNTTIYLCVIQFFAAGFYLNMQRRIPPEFKAGFNYIKNNSPEHSLVLYPALIFNEATGRPMVWTRFPSLDTLFWGDEAAAKEVVKKGNVSYIFIDQDRIYDDARTRSYSGYPESFIKRAPKLNFLTLVFENKKVMIFKVVN